MKTINNKYIFIVLIISSMVLAVTAVDLTLQKDDNLEMAAQLVEEVRQLKGQIAENDAYRQAEANRLALSRFKEHVYKLRFPAFTKTAEIVFRKSDEYGFNPYLVMAVIQVESGFDSHAVSTAGAYGLMQVNYSVWKDELDIDLNRIFEKEYNIDLGLQILRHYYDKSSGNILMALFRYNNGYKHNNTAYSGKVIATNFYNNRHKANKSPDKEENLSI